MSFPPPPRERRVAFADLHPILLPIRLLTSRDMSCIFCKIIAGMTETFGFHSNPYSVGLTDDLSFCFSPKRRFSHPILSAPGEIPSLKILETKLSYASSPLQFGDPICRKSSCHLSCILFPKQLRFPRHRTSLKGSLPRHSQTPRQEAS